MPKGSVRFSFGLWRFVPSKTNKSFPVCIKYIIRILQSKTQQFFYFYLKLHKIRTTSFRPFTKLENQFKTLKCYVHVVT